jgi:hypothetical protein
MSYYKISEKVLLNLNKISCLTKYESNIPSEYKYSLVLSCGNHFSINEEEYQALITTLKNNNLVK